MDLIDIARYFGALLLVLALVGFAGLAARKWGVPGVAKSNDTRRLAIVEQLMIGQRQRLYLIRRDDVEHLIVIGADGTRVVETNIAPRPVEAPATASIVSA
ncbi:MAG TPA: flagellar biosynthetic protein FliO [Rhizomicrobium sp.]|jgi:flagellar protein FliO/FliZ